MKTLLSNGASLHGAVATLGLSVLLAFISSNPVMAAAFEPLPFADPEQERTYRTLTEELRCLVCQNQSLADSNADLAQDLRKEVYTMVADGKDRDQVVDFMVARYGDFVLYRPPMKTSTLMLWTGPFLLGGLGLFFLLRLLRRRTQVAGPAALSEADHKRAAELLGTGNGGKDSA